MHCTVWFHMATLYANGRFTRSCDDSPADQPDLILKIFSLLGLSWPPMILSVVSLCQALSNVRTGPLLPC